MRIMTLLRRMVGVAVLVIVFGSLPTRAQTSPPTQAQVDAACLNPADDMTIWRWSYASGYLLCEKTDVQGAQSISVYAESPVGSGTFTLIKGAGGMFSPGDLVSYGVPADAATALYTGIHPQNG